MCSSTALGYLFEGACCCASHMFVFGLCFVLLDNFGFVGFLCVFFCWAIADCEYSFLLIFGFVCTFLGVEGSLECIVLVEECGGWVISLLLV